MGVIGIILLVAFVIICVLLIAIVLLQNDEGGGLADCWEELKMQLLDPIWKCINTYNLYSCSFVFSRFFRPGSY